MLAFQTSFHEGWTRGITERNTGGDGASVDDERDKMIPTVKAINAYGNLGYPNEQIRSRTAAIAQRRLSPHHGPVQVRDKSMFVPALRHKDRPAPTWMPLTTGIGVMRLAHVIKPVRLNNPTKPATTRPAAAFSSSVNLRAIATAAMAFMGCTGKGIPNATPVRILAAPVNRRVEGREMELESTRAVISGKRVPKSPNEPESSARGCDLMVDMLCV